MGWVVAVVLMAALSMVLGNVAALRQRNVKRLLAYSSVAHAGYLLVGISAVTAGGRPAEAAISSVLYYVVVYALANVGAFGALLVLASSAGGDDLDDLRGVALRAPIPSFLLLIFLLSLAGIPPMAGFFGKFYLFAAAIQADPHNLGLLWLVVLAVGMSALSLYYYLRVAKTMYVEVADDPRPIPCPAAAGGALVVLGVAVVLLGAFPSGLLGVLQTPHVARAPVLAACVSSAVALPPVNPRLTAIERGR
jgi:NADH-quinone oxidoreductase subunit N